jgi:hypothetical protein
MTLMRRHGAIGLALLLAPSLAGPALAAEAWKPDIMQVAMIEILVHMPQGAAPLADYDRTYFMASP